MEEGNALRKRGEQYSENYLRFRGKSAITRVCHLQAQNGAHLDSIFVIDMHFSLYLVGLDFFENIYLRNIPT